MAYSIIETCTGCTACVRKCPVDAIRGQRKALHSIDPSLCIDCGACGRICPSQAVLDERGTLAQQVKPVEWLKPVWDYKACVACRICVLACPTGAISLLGFRTSLDGLKPAYPYLKKAKNCIGCSFCDISCPTAAIEMRAPLVEERG